MSPIHLRDREDVVIYRAPAAYISHPTVAKLSNGDYLTAFNETLPRRPYMHPPTDPRFVNLMARSRDRGVSWETPRVVPGYEWTGVECPSIIQINNGDLLLVQWQFKWYPLETARKLTAAGLVSPLLLRDPGSGEWREPHNDDEWEQSPLPWARGDADCFVHISSDNGATWENTTQVDISPYPRGYSPRPPTQLADGTLVLALGSHDPRQVSYVVHSYDNGRTWGSAVEVTPRDEAKRYGEPTILALSGGKLLLVCRESSITNLLHQSESFDGGKTWSPLQITEMWGYPAHLVLLKDGRVLCVYGRRKPPYGIRACLSVDEGQSWQTEQELIIRDDMKNANLGYPTAIQEEDGRIFVVYYGEDDHDVTYVLGSHFQLP